MRAAATVLRGDDTTDDILVLSSFTRIETHVAFKIGAKTESCRRDSARHHREPVSRRARSNDTCGKGGRPMGIEGLHIAARFIGRRCE